MQRSPYNNPMLAQGLSGLVQAFTGNPQAEAQSLEAASRARLNNQTSQFRDAIGETGLSGDLASMMIRSLQAGPDYSRYAPGIGDATIRMGAMGFGGEQHTPSPGIAQLMMGGGRSGGGGGRSGGGGAPVSAARSLGAGDRSRFITAAGRAGMEPEEAYAMLDQIESGLAAGQFDSPEAAFAQALSPQNWEREETVTNPGGTMLSRAFSGLTGIGGDPSTWEPDAVSYGPIQGLRQAPSGNAPSAPLAPSGAGDSVQILNQAREAINQGKDRQAVIARLIEMGIDPGGL